MAPMQSHRAWGLRRSSGFHVEVLARHGHTVPLDVDRVTNCTGIAEQYPASRRPLIRSLLSKGLVGANALGSGFSAHSDGALVDAAGQPSDRVYTLGPPRYGDLLERTAVPEIRVQAERLVVQLTALSPKFIWVGIYGVGVCGTAVATNGDLNVPDVTSVENYLSCSLKGRMPLRRPRYVQSARQ